MEAIINAVIQFLGRDTFVSVVLFVAVNIRAGKPEKIPIVQGFSLSFTPFFIVLCILYIFEYALSLFGLAMPTKIVASVGGLFGFLGNSWLIGLAKNGKLIEEGGALESIAALVKAVVNFFKKTE